MFSRLRNRIRDAFRRRSVRWGAVIVLVVVVILVIGIIRSNGDEEVGETSLPAVTASSLQDLLNGTTVEQTGVIEPALRAPLVARGGGRVTAINAHVGQAIGAQHVVVEIDGGSSANPTRANTAGLRKSLTVLDKIEAASVAAANVSIDLAEDANDAADTSKGLSINSAQKARQQSDIAVEQARLSLEDARDVGDESLIRSADIAFKQARAAQDQATLALRQAQETSSQGIKRAALSVESAKLARSQSLEQFASQRQSLLTQLSVAAAQLGQQQITSPFNGEITRLTVSIGDVLTPGQIVGEVNANEGATIRLHVSAGIAAQVEIGSSLVITDKQQSFTGTVAHRGNIPDSATGLWQVDISVTETPATIYPGQSVAVQMPAASFADTAVLLPLETVVVRESTVVVFSVSTSPDGSSRVKEHIITPIGYEGDTVVTELNLSPEAHIVTDGQRLLQDGDEVQIVS